MSTRLPLTLLLLAACLAGCGYKKTWVAADPMELTAKPKGYDLLVTREGTQREHRVLGELVVSGRLEPSWSTENSHDRFVDELRKEAIHKGADAVIGLKTSEMDRDGHTEMSVSGQLIIYTAPPPIASRN
ncbi:MAG TPA: hypothetical protein VF720_15110 [Candidatus Eisenbacteria bacterium]